MRVIVSVCAFCALVNPLPKPPPPRPPPRPPPPPPPPPPAGAAAAPPAAAPDATAATAAAGRCRRGIREPLAREVRLGLCGQACCDAEHQHHSDEKEIPSQLSYPR